VFFRSAVRFYHGASFVQYFITDLCTKVNHSNFLSTDNLKIFCKIKYTENCNFLESDTKLENCVANNHMEFNKRKQIILFICRTNGISFNYYFSNVLIMHAKCIEDLGVMLDGKLHVDCLYWKTIKLLRSLRALSGIKALTSYSLNYIKLLFSRWSGSSAYFFLTWSDLRILLLSRITLHW
jgi:hypothetical protein